MTEFSLHKCVDTRNYEAIIRWHKAKLDQAKIDFLQDLIDDYGDGDGNLVLASSMVTDIRKELKGGQDG